MAATVDEAQSDLDCRRGVLGMRLVEKTVKLDELAAMRHPLLRPILVIEFLLALQASFTLWSHVGGAYHLTLVYWPWKLGIGVGAATLVVAMTATLVHTDGAISRRVLSLASMLVIVMLAAGALSYYAHLNEPAGDDQDDESGSTTVSAQPTRRGARCLPIIVELTPRSDSRGFQSDDDRPRIDDTWEQSACASRSSVAVACDVRLPD